MYLATEEDIAYSGVWETIAVSAEDLGTESSADYRRTSQSGARFSIPFNGREVEIVFSVGQDHGIWGVEIDGRPFLDEDTGEPVTIDAYNPTVRYGESESFRVDDAGEHTLTLVNTGEKNPNSHGTLMTLAQVNILPAVRQSNLGLILGILIGLQLIGLVLALLLGRMFFSGPAATIDTKRGILLALMIYTIIAIWGYFLNSVIEYWFLAWMVAVVQGGSQALSRSLFSNMSPASKSGEFFGFFGIMEKFSAIIGPLVFAFAAAQFGSSRPAVLSIIFFFIMGGYLLTRVNVEEGKRVARAEDAAFIESRAQY
jgi:hypothetical protein